MLFTMQYDTKMNIDQKLYLVSWCLCGIFFWLAELGLRVRQETFFI